MNYAKLTPENTFIHDYMQYMYEVETSYSYDFWCSLWAIGAGVGRSVFIDRPRAPVYLNWYIVLAAESGTTRKTTAVKSISSIIKDYQRVNLITARTTPTGFIDGLQDRYNTVGECSAHLSYTEMVSILGREGYMRPMPGILTDLYDCPASIDSPGNYDHKVELRDVYISFISASTPTWLATDINPSVIEGGFTSRVIFVVDELPKRKIAWPKHEDNNARSDLLLQYTELCEAARRIGPIKVNPSGIRVLSNWYNKRDHNSDAFQSSFEAREDDHILRLASCLCINDRTYEVQSKHIRNAIRIISDVKSKANLIFGDGVSYVSKMGNGIDLVRKHLIKAGMDGLGHTELYKKIRQAVSAEDYKLMMKLFHEAGIIQMFEKPRGGKHYRANRSIEGAGVTQKVLSILSEPTL